MVLRPVTCVYSHGCHAGSGPLLHVRRIITTASYLASLPCVFPSGHTTYHSWSPLLISLGCCLLPPKLRPDPSGYWWSRPLRSNSSPGNSRLLVVLQSRWVFGSSTLLPNSPTSTPDVHAIPCLKCSLPSSAPAEISVPTPLSSRSKHSPASLGNPSLVSQCRSFCTKAFPSP